VIDNDDGARTTSAKDGHLQQRWAELIAALFFAIIGSIVVFDSFRTGFRWASDGPEPGYFPFYIGVTLIASAAWVIFQTLKGWSKDGGSKAFAQAEEFRLVLRMFIPICLFAAGVFVLGIYAAAIIYITTFMIWEGKFSWIKSLSVGIAVPLFLFILFEVWFMVPLPKGPIEAMLGY
jgi:putative tricarboxylic transport membrane protein